MASEEVRKKWGTIFMGEREASVEQLHAMQEHVNRDRLQKERAEDYMERVKARAADRAREILGAAYAERQKVLEEAKSEAQVQKRLAMQEVAKIRAEGEGLRQQAEAELAAARAEKEDAAKIREGAYEDGYQAGMDQAGAELHEFRAELGQSVGAVLRGLERQRKNILANWREDLAALVKAAAAAGTGLLLQKEHEQILRQLVFQALDMLENRSAITVRVNPLDEESVSDLFHAARERVPELKQWTVIGDDTIERGGLVADSGSGSVDLRRANFRELVDNVLMHLGLPELEREHADDEAVASLVEQEVAHIASLTPELAPLEEPAPEPVVEPEPALAQDRLAAASGASSVAESVPAADPADSAEAVAMAQDGGEEAPAAEAGLAAEAAELPEEAAQELIKSAADPSLAELEEELFPLDGEEDAAEAAPVELDQPESKQSESGQVEQTQVGQAQAEPGQAEQAPDLDQKTLTEGGFL
ncbi:MAG: flagellar assembly protein FliH [Desulfovibrio sp.]|nr:flagellar assembly protein FliH [Desulfovibrio sp.]